MRRFTLTPRKSIHINTGIHVNSSVLRTSISMDDAKKSFRNIRDKEYRQMSIKTIFNFLTNNKYDGNLTQNTLTNPSNKDFQSIVKFIFSYLDPQPFNRFEDDIIQILKILKYPYSNEITRSQLSSITPHAWPAILSMICWVVELITNCEKNNLKEQTVESEFFKFVCIEYEKFMNNEEDNSGEEEFMEKMKSMHSKENEQIESVKEEIELQENELKTILSKFEDIGKLEQKKKKQKEDLNMLIQHQSQIESRKIKYGKIIEEIKQEILKMEEKTEVLLKEQTNLNSLISDQEINIEDIQQLQKQKLDLMRELDRIKPVRDQLLQNIKNYDNELILAQDYHDNILNEISTMRTGDNSKLSVNLTDYDNELSDKKETLTNFEINNKNLEVKIAERVDTIKDYETQHSYLINKLTTMGAIYTEKKDIFDIQQQQSLNDLDRLENHLLKLKLESVSSLQKSEKELSERRIEMDLLESQISREIDEINKAIWIFHNDISVQFGKITEMEGELKALLNDC